MKERGIIFTDESVRAILAGTQTQTRRIMKSLCSSGFIFYDYLPNDPYPYYFRRRDAVWDSFKTVEALAAKYCPFGTVGDRLWVRETYAVWDGGEYARRNGQGVTFRADCLNHKGEEDADTRRCRQDYGVTWKSPVLMPRWASRLTLAITDIRVERLQSITEEDAKAEGVQPIPFTRSGWPIDEPHRDAFAEAWDKLNTKRGYGWTVNPWVWCISFQIV